MELNDIESVSNLDELRTLKRRKLVERHKGTYRKTSYPENHILPFEIQLRSLDNSSPVFTKSSEFDFLHQGKSQVRLSKKGFREACEALYRGSDKGEDYFSYAKETISKHIRTITNKSLADWLKDKEFGQDAYKTAYLLYDLHLATPSGLEMLTKTGDPRFAEVELFTSHHQAKNKNSKLEDDQVIVLSTWLKEFFSKALYQRSDIERGMAKNLDLIFNGYLFVHRVINTEMVEPERTKIYSEVFDRKILDRSSPIEEPLSIKLMRVWQSKAKYHNLINHSNHDIERCFFDADKPIANQRTITSEVDHVLLLGARLFSWHIRSLELKQYRPLTPTQLGQLSDTTKKREKLIYGKFVNDYRNGTKLRVKGIGEDSKKTSLFNSLEALVCINRSILEANKISTEICLNDNCETHFNYLLLRAQFACNAENQTAQDFINAIKKSRQKNAKIIEFIENYINKMTLNQLYREIKRVDDVMSKYTQTKFMLFPSND